MKASKIFIIFLTVFIDLLGFGIIIPILPNYAISLGASTLTTGIIAGSFSLMNFLMTTYLGSWSDKIGRRPVLLFTILMNGLSYLLLAFSKNILFVLFSRIIAGIGSANISVAQAYIADITPPQDRTKKMGLIGMAFGLGFILGPPIGGFLKSIDEHHGIMYVGLFTSFMCFINLISVYFFLQESNINLNLNLKVKLKPINNIRKFIFIPVIKEYLWYGFVFLAAFSIFQVLSTIYWEQHCLVKAQDIGLFFGFVGIVSVFWQSIGLRLLLKKFNEYQIIIASSVLMSLALLSLVFLNSNNVIPLVFIVLFFISMGNGLISPCITSLLSQKAEKGQSGILLGVFQSLNSLARTIAPPFGGFLYDLNFAYPFIFAAVVMFSSIRLIQIVKNKMNKTNYPDYTPSA